MSNKFAKLTVLLTATLVLGSGVAQADQTDPLFVLSPQPPLSPQEPPIPPPSGYLEGPCGIAVDSGGDFYVSDYYHDAVDVFSPGANYLTQLSYPDPHDGPCGLALDSSDRLYVNVFHRDVLGFSSVSPFAPPAEAHPTGVAVDPATDHVYVNARTYVAVFEGTGAPVLDGGIPLKVGLGSLDDGYGLAVSGYPGTAGQVYVADAATNTVKIYDPTVNKLTPVGTISGPDGGDFVSLRDSALALDRVSGKVYVADNLQPQHTEEPKAAIYVFGPDGTYLGRLKHSIVDALPPGLAVDNSAGSTQGRVYVTSGNTIAASVYAYGPGAETDAIVPLGAPGSALSAAAAPAPAAAAEGADPGASQPASANSSKISQKGPLRLSISGRISPRKLPRRGKAPVAVAVRWKLSTVDGAPVPELRRLRIEINGHGDFDYTGLPICPYERIETASSARALAACRSALVGQGSFTAEVSLAGQEPYENHGRLLIFNGRRRGRPVLLGQIYSAHPFATSFVIPFAVEKVGRGAYGTALSASLPRALSSWGNLTGIEMRLSRRYGYRGARRSYVSAGCPAPSGFTKAVFPLARTSFDFANGTNLHSVLTETCNVRG